MKRISVHVSLNSLLLGIVFAFCLFTKNVNAKDKAANRPSGIKGKQVAKPCIPGFSKDSWNCLKAGDAKKNAPAGKKKPNERIKPTPTGNRKTPTAVRNPSGKNVKKPVKAKKNRPGLKGSSDAPALG